MHIIVGLGNPGYRYSKTRHNLGFRVVDHLALKWGGSFSKGNALFENSFVKNGTHTVQLVKPLTFMNRSGEAVRNILDMYSIRLDELLILVDDFALPMGRLRMRPRGSDGGHNGLASIIQSLGSSEFARLRMGIGLDPNIDSVDYVLSPFQKEEQSVVQEMIVRSSEAVIDWMDHGIQFTMNKYNG